MKNKDLNGEIKLNKQEVKEVQSIIVEAKRMMEQKKYRAADSILWQIDQIFSEMILDDFIGENKNNPNSSFDKRMKKMREEQYLSDEEIVDRFVDNIDGSALLMAGGFHVNDDILRAKISYKGDSKVMHALLSRAIFSVIKDTVGDCQNAFEIADVCITTIGRVENDLYALINREYGKEVLDFVVDEY